MPVWQVSDIAVAHGHEHGHAFFDHGVLLIGPGYTGPWHEELSEAECDGPFVKWLVQDMELGDTVVLRRGTQQVTAVGVVAGEYEYLEQFDDVSGWDLRHARRIHWDRLANPHDFDHQVFGGQARRLCRVRVPDVLEFVLENPADGNAVLPALPDIPPALNDVPENVADLVAQAQELNAVYWNQLQFGDHVREDEFLAHYVVPLFRCLGWPPEQIAVKWRNVDVTLFHALPRIPENVAITVEVKRLGAHVDHAVDQLLNYQHALGIEVPAVVTDRFRWRLYAAGANANCTPQAYANLTNLKHDALYLFEALQMP